MNHRIVFGATGLEVSPICFGTWQLSPRFWGEQSKTDVLAAMNTAFDAGINFTVRKALAVNSISKIQDAGGQRK